MIEAVYYQKLTDEKVRCRLCPHECLIYPGRVGICYVRQNRGGRLYALTYNRVSAAHLDPIEKKPLFHFHPGAEIYSISSIGCNLGCPYCQNWQLAQPKDRFLKQDPEQVVARLTWELTAEDAVTAALDYQTRGNIGLAYTYNEPLIWFEYLRETMPAARKQGLKNILVTNGYINSEPLAELLPFIDAVNIDIKGFSDDFYHRLGGRLNPVLKTAEAVKRTCHLEVTNLLIPSWNSDAEQIKMLVDWIADNLGADTPLHFSRYFPARKLNLPPTPLKVLRQAEQIALERLRYVHLGNV